MGRRQVSLAPIFSPICRVGTDGLVGKRCLQHGCVDALPSLSNAFHSVRRGAAPESCNLVATSRTLGVHRLNRVGATAKSIRIQQPRQDASGRTAVVHQRTRKYSRGVEAKPSPQGRPPWNNSTIGANDLIPKSPPWWLSATGLSSEIGT